MASKQSRQLAHRRLRPGQIRTDAGTQTRARIDDATCAEYAEQMVAGDQFPPVVVFEKNGKYVLADGFHRLQAAQMARVNSVWERFCFLRLHGSVGWWVKVSPGNRSDPNDELRYYWPPFPTGSVDLDGFGQAVRQGWEPLIAFPHEKHRAIRDGTDFLADRYLENVQAHAAEVLANATEVRIIGYSFAMIDITHVVDNLLAAVPDGAKIVVQNSCVGTVRARLEAYPRLRGRVDFDSTPF